MGIADAIAPMSKYNQTHFKQLISTFEKEYSFGEYIITRYGTVFYITDRTITGMEIREDIGTFFYTSTGDLYFYNARSMILPKSMPCGFFKTDIKHRLITDFMLHFKFKRLVSLATKHINPNIDKAFMEAEELYRVYWVKHDKS